VAARHRTFAQGLIYVIAIFGVLHYWWLLKRDISQPVIHAAILAGYLKFASPPAWMMVAFPPTTWRL
jgi:DMSO/TMAO reductase YedYZ heme-binding membrane subunit